MVKVNSLLRAATGVAFATLVAQPLAGCSGASSALPGASSMLPAAASAAAPIAAPVPLGAQPDKKKKKAAERLYVANNQKNEILVFNAAIKNSAPISTITSGIAGPNGIAVDKSGDLWVANTSSNTVTEYAPNASTPELTLSSSLNQPYDVKVDGFGDVFVANVATGSSTNYIVEYLPNVGVAVATWPVAQSLELSGIALANPLSSSEIIYALEYSGNPDYGYTGGLLKCPTLGSQLTCNPQSGFTFGETGGLAVAQSPIGSQPLTLLAVDQYLPGYDVIAVGKSTTQVSTGGTPEFITLDSTGKHVFVSDRFYGRVDEYSYPGGQLVTTFSSSGKLYGVATSPSGSYH